MAALVLDPDVAYSDVAAALAADWEGGAMDRAAALGDEPVSARWTRGTDEVTWSANPALGLRILDGTGLRAVRDRVSALTTTGAVALARGGTLDQRLLGVTALGLMGDPDGLPVLADLAADGEPSVRAAAALASRRIGLATLVAGASRVAERRRRRPGRDPVLGLVQPVAARRQVLRQAVAEPPADADRLHDLVAAGLEDADWEVRWSAVVGVHRHGLSGLLREVRDCSTAGVLGSGTREVLEVVRDVVGHRLAGSTSGHPGAARVGALLDGDDRVRDLPFLLLTALSTSVPEAPPARPGFAAVPAVPHWLGGPQHGVRRLAPETFEIAVEPWPDVVLEDLERRLAELAERHRVPVRLPRADELECATRGPDARRYPWGNGRERRADRVPSAWGLSAPLTSPEWVQTADGPRVLPVPRFGYGQPPEVIGCAALRPVVTNLDAGGS